MWNRIRRVLLAAMLGVAVGCSPGPEHTDVVLITVDTLRADRLGAYGHAAARTPQIDQLAQDGRRFTQAITPFPRTSPAVASLFTGLWPHHHGSREVGGALRRGTTLAEVLAGVGYATLGVSSNLAAGKGQGLDRGFQQFVERSDLPNVRATHVTTRALELVAGVPRSQPLFLWAHYSDPHFPYEPPAAFVPPGLGDECAGLVRDLGTGALRRGWVDSNRDGVAARALPACRALYDAEIAYADTQIGRLLAGLGEAGRLERALVVFTSDHGENLGEGDLYFEHGPSVHDASLRVPLVFAGRDVAPGVDRGVAGLEDLKPTILSWVSLKDEAAQPGDGVDLSARLRGESPQGEARVGFAEGARSMHVHDYERLFSGTRRLRCLNGPALSLCRFEDGRVGLYDPRRDPRFENDLGDAYPELERRLLEATERLHPANTRERTARDARFKLVERPLLSGSVRMLYDLDADPAEERDISAEHPDVAAQLSAALDDWAGAEAGAPPPPPSEEQLELLRKLGYVD